MVVELIAEHLIAAARGNVHITLALTLKLSAKGYVVGILHPHLLTALQSWDTQFQPACQHAAHIHQPDGGGLAHYTHLTRRLRAGHACHGQRCAAADDAVTAKHLGRSRHACDADHLYGRPCTSVEGCRREVGWHLTSIHTLTTELQGIPAACVAIAAGRGLPLPICLSHNLPAAIQQLVYLGLDQRALMLCLESVVLIPPLSSPDDNVVLSVFYERSHVVGHYQRVFVELRHSGLKHMLPCLMAVDVEFMIA